MGSKTTSEEKEKELPPLPNLKIKDKIRWAPKLERRKEKELPPLPNLKIKDKMGSKTTSEEKKRITSIT